MLYYTRSVYFNRLICVYSTLLVYIVLALLPTKSILQDGNKTTTE